MNKRRMLLSGMAACVFSAAMLCGAFARPAFAQAPDPKAEAYFQKYIAAHPELQRNPGLLNDPNYLRAHPSFQKFLENHPNVARQAHEMGATGGHHHHHHEAAAAYPPGEGAYDQHHQWHDRNWWVNNDRSWVETHQPGWLRPQTGPAYAPYANSPYPPPAGAPYAHGPYPPPAGAPYGHKPYPPPAANPAGVGAYDQQHNWHDRNWWVANNRAWVQQNHPEWVHH